MSSSAEKVAKKKKSQFKVVVRRLPRDLTAEEFREQCDPLPQHDFFYFVPSDKQFLPLSFARCYITFTNEQDVLDFSSRFGGYTFVDGKGNATSALVELAINDKISKASFTDVGKDSKCGKVEDEIEFKRFVDELNEIRQTPALTIEEQLKKIQEKENMLKRNAVQMTPLAEFMIEKNNEKYRRKEDRKANRFAPKPIRETVTASTSSAMEFVNSKYDAKVRSSKKPEFDAPKKPPSERKKPTPASRGSDAPREKERREERLNDARPEVFTRKTEPRKRPERDPTDKPKRPPKNRPEVEIYRPMRSRKNAEEKEKNAK